MATKVWDSVSGNWNDAGSWDPAGVPVSDDEVIFPASATVAPTMGLDQSSVDLDVLRTEPGFVLNVGSAGMHLSIAADLIVHQGSGTLWHRSNSSSSHTDQLVIDSPNWDNACTIGRVSGSASLQHYNQLTILRGKLIALGGVDIPYITDLEMAYRTSLLADAIADFSAGARVSSLRINAGIAYINNTFPSFIIDQADGRIQFTEDNAVKVNSIRQAGGVLDMRGYPSSGTDLATTVVLMGGIQTWLNDPRPKSINSLLVMPGSTLLLPDTVTVTSGGSMVTPPII